MPQNLSSWTRRGFLKSGAAFAGIAGLGALNAQALGNDTIVLTAKPGSAHLARGIDGAKPTAVWAYNNTVPGPVIRTRVGKKLRVRLINKLDQPTTLHWHGLRIDNAMDGVPDLTQKPVMPGHSFDYQFTPPDAGTYWYHTHNRTWEQLARGLSGLLIVEEKDPLPFDRDLALAIDDWRLGPDGALDEQSFGSLHDWSHQGRLGNWMTVNGASNPQVSVRSGERVRLRLVNTANARIFRLALEGEDFHLLALDGRAIDPIPLKDGRIVLAPAQRADIGFVASRTEGTTSPIQEVTYDKPFTFAGLVYGAALDGARNRILPKLPRINPALDLGDPLRITLDMTGGAMGGMRAMRHMGRMMEVPELIENRRVWAFNGIAGDLDTPLFDTARGRSVIVKILNNTNWPHAMHVHGHHFKIISRNGTPLERVEWRDTVLMQRREQIEIGFAADNPGKWLLHCHMVEHAAAGMMTWFNVKA